MQKIGGWTASAGKALFVLSSVTHYTSAAVIVGPSGTVTSNVTLPYSTAATYDGNSVSILPSGSGLVVSPNSTISFQTTNSVQVTEAIYTFSDSSAITAVEQSSSVILVAGYGSSVSTIQSSPSSSSLSSSATSTPSTSFNSTAQTTPSTTSSSNILTYSTSNSSVTSAQSATNSSSVALPDSSSSSSFSSVASTSSSISSNSTSASSTSESSTSGSSAGGSSSSGNGTAIGSTSGSTTSGSTTSDSTSGSSSGSSSRSSTNTSSPSVTSSVTFGAPSISTSSTSSNGQVYPVPIISGGSYSSPITLPPVTTTIASQQATSSVSSVSSEIVDLIGAINSWKKNPDPLKDDTLDKIKPVKSDIEDLISDLGGDSSSSGCGSKKMKRGLLGAIGDVINRLSCIDEDLDNITDNINSDDVDAVDDALEDLTSETDDLTDDDNNSSSSNSDSSSSSSESSSSSSSSSESSCTTTQTAFNVTVLCSPTVTTVGSSTITTQTCSPSTTVTTTGCDVTGTTTTVSTSSSSADQTPCASDTCGDSCPMGEGPLSGASMGIMATTEDCASISTSTTDSLPSGSYGVVASSANADPTPESAPSKRDLSGSYGIKTITTIVKHRVPEASTQEAAPSKRSSFSDPVGYDGSPLVGRSSSNALAKRALQDVSPPYTNYVRSLAPVWVSQQGDVSGQFFNYPLFGHAAAGVNGIYGCTSVIVSSEKGVFVSHIWEVPMFIDKDWNPTDDTQFGNVFPALRDGTANCQSLTGLVGTDDNPGPLNAIYAPKVYILTPFATQWDKDEKGITTSLRYQDRANSLLDQVAGIIPGENSKQTVLGYTRTDKQSSTAQPGTAGRAILEVDPFQYWLTSQNDPTSAGLQVGRWRLWVEDQLITYQDFWLPNTNPPPGTIQQKRDVGYANPCASYASSSSSSTGGTPSSTSSSQNSTSSGSQISPTSSTTGSSSGSSSTTESSSGSSSATGSSSGSGTTTSSSSSQSTTLNPSSCVYTVTSEIGITTSAYTLQPTVATMCLCDSEIQAGIATVTGTSSTSYLVCQVPSSITVSTLQPPSTTSSSSTPPPTTSSTPATPSLPSSCTSTSPRETGNEYAPPDQTCAGSDGHGSDVFTCGSNSTLFELFAPGGTPHSRGEAKNDEGGWATFGGGGCFCINGNFCCNTDATTCLPIGVNFFESFNDGPGANEVEWFQSDANGGQCSCNG